MQNCVIQVCVRYPVLNIKKLVYIFFLDIPECVYIISMHKISDKQPNINICFGIFWAVSKLLMNGMVLAVHQK